MTMASYRIYQTGDGWSVKDGNATPQMTYATREAAFEIAIASASNAIKQGYAVKIDVEAPQKNEPAIG